MKRYIDDLESAEAVIISLASTIEARDRTKGQCQRLANVVQKSAAVHCVQILLWQPERATQCRCVIGKLLALLHNLLRTSLMSRTVAVTDR